MGPYQRHRSAGTGDHNTARAPLAGRVIFYQPLASGDGVEIVRVIEGHRDIKPEMFE
jgi:plasmid stabilization system protein ParE